jgi:hypothetical protein
MQRLAILLLAVSLTSLLTGCDDFKKAFNESYNKKLAEKSFEKSFTESWKNAFVKSCVANDNSKLTFCSCVANKSIETLSEKQLNDIEVIKEKILPLCK